MTRILIADDHDVIRTGLRAILSGQSGWEVVAEAENGRQAVDLAVETQPDVAILDYQLPVLNGVDATREIRAFQPQTEVLIFTMHEGEPLLRELFEAGAHGYLLRSDARQFLIAAVAALAQHEPFFTGGVSETLLNAYLSRRPACDGALTARERSIVQLIAEGHSNRAAAQTLGLSQKTVEGHRAAAMRKAKVNSTAHLVRYAVRTGLVEP
ncbi:DNA-binding response regulator (plasmid) [Microvirga ossetica]|uniref:DNA-binding response regulator n=1 Tax=Microvirga ossetica TaxID=1882682 RepID=A0A1B2EUI2_9HYPH|nr:response regulator transcription factor [Microvirga ossetica]ANY83626.1 DNA-binding response regulator [Microvirga ossetica]